MADATATRTRSRRAAEEPDEQLGAQEQDEGREPEPYLARLPKQLHGLARERLERLRHRSRCPADGRTPNEPYQDDDGVDRVARIEFVLVRQSTKREPDPDLQVGTDTVVVRCIECGEQEPPSNT